jgi:hypothetical protein
VYHTECWPEHGWQAFGDFGILYQQTMQSFCRSRALAAGVSVLVLLVLLGAIAFLYSGLHKHDRLSLQPCAFHSFERSPGLQAFVAIEVPQPVASEWYVAENSLPAIPEFCRTTPTGRAPPACL